MQLAVQARPALGYPCRVLPFPATHQSVLERIRSTDAETRRAAFGDLAEGYWRPSYHYVRLHWRLDPEQAEDVVQGFFATAFEKKYLERYDPGKARFRTFLRVCLDRYVQNRRKADRAARRGGETRLLSIDFPDAEREFARVAVRDIGDIERFFHDEFIRALFARTVDGMRERYALEGKDAVFAVFERHDLQPGPDTTYRSVAESLDLTTSQVTNYLHAARKRFRELALEHLRALVGSGEEFRQEARDLFGLDIDA
jgi:RNA polymerase sigma factor (sigma-70 family)